MTTNSTNQPESEKHPSGLTEKQRKALNKRIAENTEIVKKRVGSVIFNKAEKAVDKVMSTKKVSGDKSAEEIKTAYQVLCEFDRGPSAMGMHEEDCLEAMEAYATQQTQIATGAMVERIAELEADLKQWKAVAEKQARTLDERPEFKNYGNNKPA